MHIRDSEELFDLVPMGTPVTVTYDTVLVGRDDNNDVAVSVFPDFFGKAPPSLAKVQQQISRMFPGAEIDSAQLAEALSQPREKPVIIGHDPSGPVLSVTGKVITNPDEEQPSEPAMQPLSPPAAP
jgi:hypothetical protein